MIVRCVATAIVVSFVAFGCGGNSEDPKTASSKASLSLSPFEELKAIPSDLQSDVAGLTKPIDDVQSVLDELAGLPKKHGLTAADVSGLAKATFEKGTVEVKLNGDASAEAKAEVEAALKKLDVAVKELKATPQKVAALTSKLATISAKVPVLATKVSSTATATVSNPFADAAAKAKAQAELDGVKQAQAAVTQSIGEVQKKVADIPQMATGALGKVTASFSGST